MSITGSPLWYVSVDPDIGYFLNSSSVSVLSIPSFDLFDVALSTAQTTVEEFIRRTQEAGLQRVVIDLQKNGGGQVLLAVDTFKRFFPDIEPFGGSRLRASRSTNVMGEAITDYFNQLPTTDPDYGIFSTVEWVATTRIDAETNSNFTSWNQFFGPVLSGDDAFTTTVRSLANSTDLFMSSRLIHDTRSNGLTSPAKSLSTTWSTTKATSVSSRPQTRRLRLLGRPKT